MRGREKVKVNNGKLLVLILGVLAAATPEDERLRLPRSARHDHLNAANRTEAIAIALRKHLLKI